MSIKKWFTKEYAVLKDDHGITLANVKISRDEYKFIHNKRTYNVIRDDIYSHSMKGLFIHKRFYFYNVNVPDPLSFNKKRKTFEPLVRPDLYNTLLEAEILIKLNTVNNSFLKNIKAWHIILFVCIIGAILYYMNSSDAQPITSVLNATNDTITNSSIIRNSTNFVKV